LDKTQRVYIVSWLLPATRSQEAVMSLTNAPDPAIREAVVQQDLKNVLHPIVQHKALEAKQIVHHEGSTIYLLVPPTSCRAVVRQHRLRPR
jgi:hypothetical protein